MTNIPANDFTPQTTPAIDVSILHQPWEDAPFDAMNIIGNIISEALASAALPKNAAQKNIEVSVALVSDEIIQELNKEFRNKDKPTNVLSFEFDETTLPTDAADLPLGDIVLSYETILREAEEQEKKFEHHFTHITLHGFLHLLGYDHIDDKDAETMEAKEIEILKGLGIENPYL